MRRRLALALGAALVLGAVGGGVYVALDEGWLHLNTQAARRYPVRGVDVSRHQGPIDWPRVAKSGVAFVYVKATEGGDWTDPRFEENRDGARRAGLKVGAYHYFTFCRPAEEQARHFLSVAPREADALPPAVDVEYGGNCSAAPPPGEVRAALSRWLELVGAELGRRPVVYVTPDAESDFVAGAQLDAALWLRNVFFEPPRDDWTFWQFDARGEVPGISGPVDLDVFRGDRAALDRL